MGDPAQRLRRPTRARVAAAILFAVACLERPQGQVPVSTPAEPLAIALGRYPHVPGEIVVRFADGNSGAAAERASADAGLRVAAAVGRPSLRTRVLRTDGPLADSIQRLRNVPGVLLAEPNWIYERALTPDDDHYVNGTLWNMYGREGRPNPFGTHAADLWVREHVGSSDVFVAVLDEGIDVRHPDLAPNAWTNPADPLDGFDNDGNGHVDDVHGWDFVHDDNSVIDSTGLDDYETDSHGTHVAGTIGARGGNSIGVAGMAWRVTLISAKTFHNNNSTLAIQVAAFDYVNALKVRGVNIVAINCSWGGGAYAQQLHDAVIRSAKLGILVVAAAGNDARNTDVLPFYPAGFDTRVGTSTEAPASFDAVISVTAIDSTGGLAPFANYGASSVDIGAPGVAIMSTYPNRNYSVGSGTSMAAPHVSGAVALYKSIHPNASAEETRAAVVTSGTLTASLAGRTSSGRRLRVGDFVPFQAPQPFGKLTLPRAARHVGVNGPVTFRWTTSPGAAAYEYCIESLPWGLEHPCQWQTTTATAVSVFVGSAGTHRWQVRARNAAGPTEADGGEAFEFTTHGMAGFDTQLRAPRCFGMLRACSALFFGRDSILGAQEWHAPNTIADSCPDGSAGSADDPYIEAIFVSSADGSLMAPGVVVDIVARVIDGYSATYPYHLEIYHAPDATNPVWTLLEADVPVFNFTNAYLRASLRLPPGPLQAIRARLRNYAEFGPMSPCLIRTGYEDHDDVVLTVEPEPFLDGTLHSGAPMRAAHLSELRSRVNALRVRHALPPVTFTDPQLIPGVVVKAIHLTELREGLDAVYDLLALNRPVYSTPAIVPRVTRILASQIMELRTAIATLE